MCLQCHMDMVVEKNDDVDINFETDPLTPRIVDNKWLMATGTSLGADNGIGIATCFAILEDKSLRHGPLEVLVTRDEETGMFGATDLEPGVLKAKYMINVDSEEQNAVCIGCAGSFTLEMTMPVTRAAAEGTVLREITLNNFIGGHSGCDIHLGRAHPLVTLGRLLMSADDCQARIVSIECGTVRNAIPRKCVVDVAVPAEKAECFDKCMQKHFDEFMKEYHLIEKTATLAIEESKCEMVPITAEATQKFVNFINVYPFAVMRYSPSVQGDIETSTTLAIARVEKPEEIFFVASVRSFAQSQMDMMYNKIRCICEMGGLQLSERIGA